MSFRQFSICIFCGREVPTVWTLALQSFYTDICLWMHRNCVQVTSFLVADVDFHLFEKGRTIARILPAFTNHKWALLWHSSFHRKKMLRGETNIRKMIHKWNYRTSMKAPCYDLILMKFSVIFFTVYNYFKLLCSSNCAGTMRRSSWMSCFPAV